MVSESAYPPPGSYPPPGAFPPPGSYPPPPTMLVPPPPGSGVVDRRAQWLDPAERSAGAVIVGALVVIGILAGIVWGLISPHSAGFVTPGFVVPDEAEGFIAADGRFLIIGAVVGLVAGTLAWFWRSRRGPLTVAALVVGGLLGSSVTAVLGHLVGGGHSSGAVNQLIKLPISLHADGLLLVEPLVAVTIYVVAVLMSGPDDLGRPEPSAPMVVPDTSGPPAFGPPAFGPPAFGPPAFGPTVDVRTDGPIS